MDEKARIKRPDIEQLIVWGLFICGTIVRFLIADRYPVRLGTYADELLYYHISAGLSDGTGIRTYNLPVDFTQILYPFILQPAFWFGTVKARLSAIFFINSAVMSAGVFPVHYMSGKLVKSRVYRICLCLAYLLLQSQTFSMTFMSEVLYVPLMLTLLCFFLKLFSEQDNMSGKGKAIFNFITGFVSYLAYMTKAVALAVPFAYAAVLFSIFIYRKIRKSAPPFGADMIRQGICYAAGFAIPYSVMKLTVFRFEGTGYPLLRSDYFNGDDRIQYLFYGFCVFVCVVVIAALIVPVVFTGVYFDKLSSGGRKFYAFLIIELLVTAAIVSYMITLGEDYPSLSPRSHMRYISWIYIPFIIVFVHMIERAEKEKLRDTLGRLGYIALFLAMLLVFFRGGNRAGSIDNGMIVELSVMKGNKALLGSAVLCAASVVGFIIFIKKKKLVVPLFLAAFSVVQMINGVLSAQDYNTAVYIPAEEDVQQADALSVFVDGHPDDSFLVIGNFMTIPQIILDTYLTQPNVNTTSMDVLTNENVSKIVLSENVFPRIWAGPGMEYEPAEYDYVIIEGGKAAFEEDLNCVRLEEYDTKLYSMYKIEDSSIPVKLKGRFLEDGMIISFTSEENNAGMFIESGISVCEGGFTWTDGDEIVFRTIGLSGGEGGSEYNMSISLIDTFFRPQTVQVICNSEVVYDDVVQGAQTITFPITADMDGFVKLVIRLPDSLTPIEAGWAEGDRDLALALSRIRFERIDAEAEWGDLAA